ncbi:GNAT family N-acetyltransferase [Nocardiopsis sp. RSe5-2]|uniref:GNAT family N-acetyltransferase n=1 Tax=Nocardiopsis endophytica TaxID=3018445 RepID=A0ABT4U4U2_9ACTN|nr:GNAT family N-acetyltransferase [Nocardiopsis endophytica]MDA2811967.1 GNAT family N-acetyltransferase [Nocardiopsis endophytica]
MTIGTWAARLAEDWPAAEVEVRGGWRLGADGGVTRRANSALPVGPEPRIEAMEAFYRERGITPCVQVWSGDPGTDEALVARVDAALEARGYRAEQSTLLMTRPLGAAPAPPEGVDVLPGPDERWRAVADASGESPTRTQGALRILGRAPVVGYAVDADGAARGSVAVGGGRCGIFTMTTVPAERGRGRAGRIMDALLAWAHAKGAHEAYLVVEADNAAAVRAYGRAGFVKVGGYRYRVAPG